MAAESVTPTTSSVDPIYAFLALTLVSVPFVVVLLMHILRTAGSLGGQCLNLRVVAIDDLGGLEKGVHRLIPSSSASAGPRRAPCRAASA